MNKLKKIPKCFLLGLLVSNFLSCASVPVPKEKPIIFPEMNVGDCPEGTERSPNALCGSRLGNQKYADWEAVIEKMQKRLAKTDVSKGKGLTNAALYLPNEAEPIRVKSPRTFWYPNQIVNFYKPDSPFGGENKGGAAVLATPTRVYLNEKGEIAYMAFDEQAVTLLEYSTLNKDKAYSKIPGQGPEQHPQGFSSPVGKLKRVAEHLSQYSIDEMRIFVGREGEEKTLEFESGVRVTGVIEKYTPLMNSGNEGRGVIITFKDNTCTVTYGVHKLFEKSWGPFDMLIMPELSDSNVRAEISALK